MTLRTQVGLVGLGAVFVADRLARSRTRSRVLSGLLDETAHLGTGLVALSAARDPGPEFSTGLVVGSVLLDLDHVPDVIGIHWLRKRRMRPFPHSVGTLLAMRKLARSRHVSGVHDELAAGAFLGVVVHLTRDLATGTNYVPLLWPFSRRRMAIPYWTYAALLLALAARGAARADRPEAAPTLAAA